MSEAMFALAPLNLALKDLTKETRLKEAEKYAKLAGFATLQDFIDSQG